MDELPKIGAYSVILDSKEEALCVIRDYDVYLRPFGEVSPFHAFSEGEGDCSLNYWRQAHTDFFTTELAECGMSLTDDTIVVCEKFSVEYIPGKEAEELLYVEPTMEYASEIEAYRKEMLETGSSFDGCFSMQRLTDNEEFVNSCINWSNPRRPAGPQGIWGNVIMVLRKEDMKMIGCMQFHNVLADWMEEYTGHIGYSVRPSERRKGYATKMLAKAKDFARSFGFEEIYASCLPDNEGSRKTILANGGEYVNTVRFEKDEVDLERYRITLKA